MLKSFEVLECSMQVKLMLLLMLYYKTEVIGNNDARIDFGVFLHFRECKPIPRCLDNISRHHSWRWVVCLILRKDGLCDRNLGTTLMIQTFGGRFSPRCKWTFWPFFPLRIWVGFCNLQSLEYHPLGFYKLRYLRDEFSHVCWFAIYSIKVLQRRGLDKKSFDIAKDIETALYFDAASKVLASFDM